ncbi:MAG: tRNA lysidine(34) synthetase TilS [Deltaproteobacteria bacterium]|nr:tRNA lysidine(34) synthetase TilS [Deltaproteobacteria bacterium]
MTRSGLRGGNLLVSVSGGCDSVCLLRILAEVAGVRGGSLRVAHVDHGLRPDSGEDARFCRDLAEELGVPFHLVNLEPRDFRRGESVQAEARRLRRAALEACARREGAGAVALGHHRDDQAETVLFRLLRGTAARGAAGMAVWDPPYVRPLLQVTGSELRELARSRGWDFREDPTNASDRYVRNRLRHRVLPLLRSFNPGAVEALARFAERMAEDDDALSALARAELERSAVREPEGLRLSAPAVGALPPAIRRRLYLAAWTELGYDPRRLETQHLEAVDALLAPGKAHRRAPVPGPAAFFRSYGDLWALRPEALAGVTVAASLARRGARPLADGALLVWGTQAPEGAPAVGVPPGRPAGEHRARTWRSGDRLAGPAAAKLKDLLMEARLPVWRRRRALVVEDDRGAFGVLAPDFAWPPGGGGDGAVWVEGTWFTGESASVD